MMKNFGLAIIVLGLSGIIGCAQTPDGGTSVGPAPDSMETFAQAAVEVGEIGVAEMPGYAASVALMPPSGRAELWQSLKILHDGLHQDGPANLQDTVCEAQAVVEGGGCSNARCSHSASCGLAQWCCAFGEDATFYQ